ncbi:MAG: hypothetical protein ACHREM_12620 [Polyangiales bacterium]
MRQTIRLRVREGFSSIDAKPFAFILGDRQVGNVWVDRDLNDRQILTLKAAGIFEFLVDERPRELVTLGRRTVDVTGRRRVVLRGSGGLQ